MPISLKILFLAAIVALSSFPAWAAPTPQLVYVFADDETQLTITNAFGKVLEVTEGLTLGPGTHIQTKATTAEFRLQPNGSLLKLGKNTGFKVKSLQNLQGAASNDFSVLTGKIRMVAAKLAGIKNAYNVSTPSAQAGVRGTDFAVEANAVEGDWICVKEGVVEFALLRQDGRKGKTILVGSGEFANVLAPTFAAKKASAADIADKFEDLDFSHAQETEVPGHALAP